MKRINKKIQRVVKVDRIIHVLAHTWRCTTRTLESESTRTASSTTRRFPTASPMGPIVKLITPALEASLAVLLNELLRQVMSPKLKSNLKIACRTIFASIRSDPLTSSNSSSSGSMTEVAPTLTGADSCDLAARNRTRQQERGLRVLPTEGWSSTENNIVKNPRRNCKKKNHEARRQQHQVKFPC